MNFLSKISHDDGSLRAYLMDLHPDDFPQIIGFLESLAHKNGYTKIFTKIPARYAPAFTEAGYAMEATIPGFYKGNEDTFFMVRYMDQARSKPEAAELKAFQELLLKPVEYTHTPIDKNYLLRPLHSDDTKNMVAVFKEVFETYPFPIFDPAFLKKAMHEDGTRFFGAFYHDELIAISSAECNTPMQNAEMTDFAVLPVHRGKRLAVHLLAYMEEELAAEGILTFYTIARLHSLPMNKTFYNLGYHFSGTLTRNTQIAGKIESMNVWYKKSR